MAEAATSKASDGSLSPATTQQLSALDRTTSSASNYVDITGENVSSDSLWVRKWDDANNSLYYFNLRTQESSWEQPDAYKAVFMSEPLDLDTQRASEDQQETLKEPQEQQNSASVAIQSLYRGRKDRQRVNEAKKWTGQFDPSCAQKYYYNSETGECQWEKPVDFLTGIKDERSARAVKIQSVFRAKKARDRVKQLADEEEEEEELKQQVQEEEEEAVADEEAQLAEAAVDLNSRALWCAYFDPRSGKYYYRHVDTDAISWEKPEGYLASWTEGSKRDVAALSIQCAARKRIAAHNLAAKREKLRALTDPTTMQLKLGELKQVSMEIQAEIEARVLVSMEEKKLFPHLTSLVSGWHESLKSIKNHVVSLDNRGEDILLAENLSARVLLSERFHKALAGVRSECLALLRGILLMNSYFVDLDVSRVNAAFATFSKWKAHEEFALRDARLLEFVQSSDTQELLAHAETLLQCSMGLTDFKNGSTSASGKRYEDWHPSVAATIVGVQEMDDCLAQKLQLLRGFRATEASKREISQMTEEDLLASRLAQQQRRRLNNDMDHATFLVKCQELWQKGLKQRDEDLRAVKVNECAKIQQHAKRYDLPWSEPTSDSDDKNKSKLSIWEAAKEGLPVEVVRAMVFAEMQKARRLGYDFLVKTARSDHGETLIQIACWWGHENLVKFFIEEGAQIDSIDSTCNRFSLLHDAARRGHSQVIHLLLDHGLSSNVTDSAGDTPFHWAARKNNIGAVVSLLGVYFSVRNKAFTDEIIKTVRQKNLRGKTAYALAKGGRVREALRLAQEGRLPPLRRPRTADGKSIIAGISRRMTEIAPRDRTRRISSPKKGNAVQMLTKATKHASTFDLEELVEL